MPKKAPFVLDADRELLLSSKSSHARSVIGSWSAAIESADFCAPGDTRLHLGLLPEPFTGDLRKASIYVLLLNPGLGATDYYGEYEVKALREARLRNLRQDFPSDRLAFSNLDPQFAWHGGFQWWHGKLRTVIAALAERRGATFAEARHAIGSRIASIELFPYRSASFNDQGKWLRNFPSVQLAREFVRDVVLPRVHRGKAIVIATRQVALWNLPEAADVIRYEPQHARGAHLTPTSVGGAAILDYFERHEVPV